MHAPYATRLRASSSDKPGTQGLHRVAQGLHRKTWEDRSRIGNTCADLGRPHSILPVRAPLTVSHSVTATTTAACSLQCLSPTARCSVLVYYSLYCDAGIRSCRRHSAPGKGSEIPSKQLQGVDPMQSSFSMPGNALESGCNSSQIRPIYCRERGRG